MAFKIGKTIAKWTVILSIIDYIIFFSLVLFSLVIVSKLGATNYGIFNISSTLYIYFSRIFANIFLTPFVKIASGYYGKKEYEKLSRFMGSVFIFILFVSILQSLFYYLITPFVAVGLYDRPYLLGYMVTLTPIFIALGVIGYGKRILLITKSYNSMALTRIADGIFYILNILLFVYLFSWTVDGLIYGTLMYNFVLAAVFLIFIHRELKKRNLTLILNFNFEDTKELIRAGKFFLASNLFMATFSKIDELVIPLYVTDESVGFYSFAKTLVLRLSNLFNRLNSLLYQAFSEQVEVDTEGTTIRKLLSKSILYTWLYTVPVSAFFVVFARELIFGVSFIIDIRGYLNAASILSIFALLIAIESVSYISNAYFNGLGKFDMQTKASFIMVTIATVFVFVLTSMFGVYGTSIAFVLAYLGGLTYWITNVKRHIRLGVAKVTLYGTLALGIAVSLKEIMVFLGIGLQTLFLAFIYVIIVGLGYFGAIILLVVLISVIDLYDLELMKRLTQRYPALNYLVKLIEKIYRVIHKEKK